ncbi:hypothetical protein KJ682_17900 [bacterium]|nr:hypothetical protein [bacterium]
MTAVRGTGGRRARARGAAAVFACLLAAVPAAAQIFAEQEVLVRGFVSQGYLNTANNNYLVPRSVNGTAEFHETGLIVTAVPRDRLRVGIQLMGRNFGDTGNDQVVLDWAFGDYRWKDELGLRAGKIKMPYGLYNEGRDVDLLRTTVFLPQSVYDERMRDFMLAYEGAAAYGSVTLGGAGDLDYHLFGGTLNVADPSHGFWGESYAEAAREIEPEIARLAEQDLGLEPGSAEATFAFIRDPEVTFPWIYGGSVTWNPPVPGLRLGASAMQGRFNYRGEIIYDIALVDPVAHKAHLSSFSLDIDQTLRVDRIYSVSAEYLTGAWQFVAELGGTKIEGQKDAGYYVQTGYRFGKVVSAAATWSQYWADTEDREGKIYEARGLPAYYAWQHDGTLSLRLDLTSHWLLKIEHHFLNGTAMAEYLGVARELEAPSSRRWGMLAAKTTFHF